MLESRRFRNKQKALDFIAEHGGYYETFINFDLSATFVVFYKTSITEEMKELYKAVKYEVENFQADHGCNVAEMWQLVNAKTPGFEHRAQWWKDTCLDDYRNLRRY